MRYPSDIDDKKVKKHDLSTRVRKHESSRES